jgi:hypothetical protein
LLHESTQHAAKRVHGVRQTHSKIFHYGSLDLGAREIRAKWSKMMERDRWEQIERLYHSALERDPGAREAYLEEACAGDEDLRREVAGLPK